jgi:MoxR-like ATPase
MQPHDPARPTVNPRHLLRNGEPEALARRLAGAGYIIQRLMLTYLTRAIVHGIPLLVEGHRGGGKTALAESLARSCNLPVFYLQGMEDLTLHDVLYAWDRDEQRDMVQEERALGTPLEKIRQRKYSREFLMLGEVLGAFDYAAEAEVVPILIIDEADKLNNKIQDMFLELFARGTAHVPRLTERGGQLGTAVAERWPVVILLSNDLRNDLSSPFRSRCLYSRLDPPSPREEVPILRAQVPEAPQWLVAGMTKMINCIRRDMPAVRDKPGVRESIMLTRALVADGVKQLTAEVLEGYLCFLGKRHKELLNLQQGIVRLEEAMVSPDEEIDEWVRWAYQGDRIVLDEGKESNEGQEMEHITVGVSDRDRYCDDGRSDWRAIPALAEARNS